MVVAVMSLSEVPEKNQSVAEILRVAIVQPSIQHYRLPLFNLLASDPNIALTVYADERHGVVTRESVGILFNFVHAPLRQTSLFGVDLRWQFEMMSLVSNGSVDVVVLPWDVHYVALLPALILARFNRTKLVLWGHGYSKQGTGLRDHIRNWYGRKADGVLLYTRTVADRLVEHGFSKNRVFVAQNALDQTSIQQARECWLAHPARLDAFRSQHALKIDRTLVFISRLEDENRVELLVECFATLRQKYNDLRLVLVGDGSAREQLRRLGERLGVLDGITFTGAIYDEELLAPWMLSATVCCYPANIGLSLMHAFGYGLPVITSDDLASQNPEIEALEHGVNGLLYRSGSGADMVSKCESLLSDRNMRRAMGDAALLSVLEGYTMVAMAAGFREAVFEVGFGASSTPRVFCD